MNDNTLMGRKLEAYVILKILKYCTGSSAKRYQCKFAVDRTLNNKRIETMDELGGAIQEVIYFKTLRGKFSSIQPDLLAEDIAGVEVAEKGLYFITTQSTSEESKHFIKDLAYDWKLNLISQTKKIMSQMPRQKVKRVRMKKGD